MLLGRSVIVLLSVSVLMLSGGCDDGVPPERPPSAVFGKGGTAPPREPSPTSELAMTELEVEAGLERGRDPGAPSGDLQRDLATFTTLDACTEAHAPRDPVLGDAIDAIGYDTLTRDACRILQALKMKDERLCQPIAASPLRARCESYVAILVGNSALCPVVTATGAGARDPLCLARANRDARLCAAALAGERATCRALVSGRATECGNDMACVRQIERWKALFVEPEAHAPFRAHLHLEFATENTSSEPVRGSYDLDDVAAAGVVANVAGDRTRLSLGTPKTALWQSRDAPLKSPRLFLEVSVRAKDFAAKRASSASAAATAGAIALGSGDMTLDLLLPGVAVLSGTAAAQRTLEIGQWGTDIGSPVRFTLTSKLLDAPRAFRLTIELETFVRDVIGTRPRTTRSP